MDQKTDKPSYVIEVNLNVYGKNAFFALMKDKFNLPYYFHNNFDSLDKCMRDLSWIKDNSISIIFKNTTRLKYKNEALYKDIIECITMYKEYWDKENPEGKHVYIDIK